MAYHNNSKKMSSDYGVIVTMLPIDSMMQTKVSFSNLYTMITPSVDSYSKGLCGVDGASDSSRLLLLQHGH